jgi:4a-hydroxytetrahydrobiopterin dehydratase
MAYDKTLLSPEALKAFLAAHPAWAHAPKDGGYLSRTYEAPSFLAGIRFVERVAQDAERHDHHPDIDIRWRKVTLGLTTHDAGGLTSRDTRAAAEADRLFDEVCKAG